MRRSTHRLVILTDVYLTKLWTVYEVACFLCLQPTSVNSCTINFRPAFASVTVILSANLLLGRAGILSGSILSCLYVPMFCSVLLPWGNVRGWCCCDEPRLFLDKVCIHQVDQQLQQIGTRKLGRIHAQFEAQARHLHRCLPDEVVDIIRSGLLPLSAANFKSNSCTSFPASNLSRSPCLPTTAQTALTREVAVSQRWSPP